VIERAATLARGLLITLGDLRIEFASLEACELGSRPTLAELERHYIQQVLDETGGDKQAAAKILGVSVRTLQRKEKEL
jgi:DNA-binding NtrC family response regulator